MLSPQTTLNMKRVGQEDNCNLLQLGKLYLLYYST